MRIKLLHQVGDDPKGAVLDDVDERRAARLVRTGYAVAVAAQAPRREKEK